MVACALAGADAVDAATDSLSGMTSQPSINAILSSLEGTGLDPGLNIHHVRALDTYWSQLRLLYSPFEAHLTGPDPEVYEHEIPGGQLTNMMFQASQLGLGSQWLETKKAYEEANDLLGDIVKVTPTSKVVGDLAQFMASPPELLLLCLLLLLPSLVAVVVLLLLSPFSLPQPDSTPKP
jgi:pyruvate carboxylase